MSDLHTLTTRLRRSGIGRLRLWELCNRARVSRRRRAKSVDSIADIPSIEARDISIREHLHKDLSFIGSAKVLLARQLTTKFCSDTELDERSRQVFRDCKGEFLEDVQGCDTSGTGATVVSLEELEDLLEGCREEGGGSGCGEVGVGWRKDDWAG